MVFERVTRIKILKKAGYDEATVEIPLYHREGEQEKISNLRGFTYIGLTHLKGYDIDCQ